MQAELKNSLEELKKLEQEKERQHAEEVIARLKFDDENQRQKKLD